MRSDELDGPGDDLPRTVVIVEDVERVATARMVRQLEAGVGGEALADESVDRFVDRGSVQPGPGDEDGKVPRAIPPEVGRGRERPRRLSIQLRALTEVSQVQHRVIRHEAAHECGRVTQHEAQERAATREAPEAETVRVNAQRDGIVSHERDGGGEIGRRVVEVRATGMAVVEGDPGETGRSRQLPLGYVDSPIFGQQRQVGGEGTAVNEQDGGKASTARRSQGEVDVHREVGLFRGSVRQITSDLHLVHARDAVDQRLSQQFLVHPAPRRRLPQRR